MRAKLFSKQGVMKGKRFEFENEATIGRSEQNEIALNRKEISKVHARIFLDPSKGCYYLEDLASANGTQLDGVKVYGKERLGHLHVITFSSAFDFIFLDSHLCKNRYPAQSVTTSAEAIPQKTPLGVKSRIEEHHFDLTPKPDQQEAQKNRDVTMPTVDETMVDEKSFVLPQGLGKGNGITTPTVDETIVDEKPFVLPQGVGKGNGGTPSVKGKDGTQ